jgi:hypothetical protein
MSETGTLTESERMSSALGGRTKGRSSDNWITPPRLKRQIYRWWGLNFDPCPYPRPEWDGLKIEWGSPEHKGRVFVNPPYGKAVTAWIERGIEQISNERASIVVYLLNARTDNSWFHDLVIGGAQELWFVRGRVRFLVPGQVKARAPAFPSILAVYYEDPLTNAILGGTWDQERGPRPARKDHLARNLDEGFATGQGADP